MAPHAALTQTLLLVLGMLMFSHGWAHEVHHQVGTAQANVVGLTYADGEPFSLERYELFAHGASHPTQTGRTDARGRVVFIAPQGSRWRLRAFSEDGHGVDIAFEAQAQTVAALPADTGSGSRWWRFGAGLGGIGLVWLAASVYLRRRGTDRTPGSAPGAASPDKDHAHS